MNGLFHEPPLGFLCSRNEASGIGWLRELRGPWNQLCGSRAGNADCLDGKERPWPYCTGCTVALSKEVLLHIIQANHPLSDVTQPWRRMTENPGPA